MKILFGKQSTTNGQTTPNARVVLDLSTNGIDKFHGFSYSVEEGQRLANRSYTELPEFKN
jgi:hypothetical protein